jgi:hypothetical protein
MIVVRLQEVGFIFRDDAGGEDIVRGLDVEGLLDLGEGRVLEVQEDDCDD